jgi:MinD superfamily P-loop ATPase
MALSDWALLVSLGNIDLFEFRVRAKLYCGRCKRTSVYNIFYVERNKERKVVIGCKGCRIPVVVITLFPMTEITFLNGNHSDTQIDFSDFYLAERKF